MSSHRFRRPMVLLLALLACSLALQAQGAEAGVRWCRKDPVFQIGGQTAHVYVSGAEDADDLAVGATAIVLTVPSGVDARFVAADRGFGGFGYDVTIRESARLKPTDTGLPVTVEVYVPTTGRMPVKVDLVPVGPGKLAAGSAEGWSNAWVTLDPRASR